MRHLFSIVTVAVTLLSAPTQSTADPLPGWLFFQISGGSEVYASFGLEPFQVSEEAKVEAFHVVDDIWVFFDSVQVALISGPLLDMDVSDVYTYYSYGAGTLTLDISASRDDGATATGQAILPTLPFSFSVCEGCDSMSGGGSVLDFEISIGNGLIDSQLAALLRIKPEIGTGYIDFGLEDIDGDPASVQRVGFDNGGYFPGQISVVEVVPEPSALLLFLTGGAAIFGRRGISRVRTSAHRSENP